MTAPMSSAPSCCESEGIYQYRKNGERHAWNPEAIYLLQWAVRTGDYQKYKQFSALVDQQNQKPHVIRGLLDFKPQTPIPLDEVEPVENILKRMTTGAMSFGSLGKDVHETIAVAMNAIGGRSNSGEGGEEPERYAPAPRRNLGAQRDQAGGVRRVSASRATIWSTPTNCRSRSRRARNPAKAASFPATRSIRSSPARATRRPA